MPRDPEELIVAGAPATATIPAQTRPGAVHLTVADLARSIAFYEHMVGLRVRERTDERVVLGSDEDLVVLHERDGATPSRGYCGLFHFALVVPERIDLARWLVHAATDHVPLTGLSDHFVSEAIYLNDPDQHGIEIYWDRPRTLWEGQVAERMTTKALDVDDLLALVDDPAGAATYAHVPGGTVMGHVHLRVAAISETIRFYRKVLGFALMAEYGREAAFLSAGGYHHHIGANTWESAGGSQPPNGSATLTQATILLPDEHALDRLAEHIERSHYAFDRSAVGVTLRDPSGNPLALQVAARPKGKPAGSA